MNNVSDKDEEPHGSDAAQGNEEDEN